jgi:acetyl-CoA C-acetyltransferase
VKASIVGSAELAPTRDTGGATTLSLSAAILDEALADAGLARNEVDGILVHPMAEVSRLVPSTVVEYAGLQVSYADSVDLGGATAAGMIWRASSAITSGMCSVCVCLTAAPRASASGSGPSIRTVDRSPAREFEVPYGNVGATEGYAMIAQRYEAEYGDTARERALLAVAQRRNAAGHPKAIFAGVPLTEDDVLGSEMIADPLRKLEMVMPVGGAGAVVVARDDIARRASAPVRILGAGEAITHKSVTFAPDLTHTAIRAAAGRAFAQAGIKTADISVASLYDCYTITVLLTLEDAGFCPKGHAAEFVRDHDLTWAGDFPLNTNGGQLSFGQADVAGGMGQIVEAVLQLQGRAGRRQVADPGFAFVNGNGGVMSEQVSLILGSEGA